MLDTQDKCFSPQGPIFADSDMLWGAGNAHPRWTLSTDVDVTFWKVSALCIELNVYFRNGPLGFLFLVLLQDASANPRKDRNKTYRSRMPDFNPRPDLFQALKGSSVSLTGR